MEPTNGTKEMKIHPQCLPVSLNLRTLSASPGMSTARLYKDDKKESCGIIDAIIPKIRAAIKLNKTAIQ